VPLDVHAGLGPLRHRLPVVAPGARPIQPPTEGTRQPDRRAAGFCRPVSPAWRAGTSGSAPTGAPT
jgi:hypothetical protein